MIIYKCDNCEKSDENYEPENWLKINGQINNNLKNRKIISVSRILHFCSRKCFDEYFFLCPDIKLFEKDMEGFKYAIDATKISELDKRKLFLTYFQEKYNIDKLKPLKDDLNGLIEFYFPITDKDAD